MQQKKNINVFIFPIVALFTFVMLVFGAAYAYLSGIVNMNTANYQVVLPSQTSLVCTKTDCSVTVTPAMMLNTNTGSSAKTSSTCAVNCTCTGTQGAVCDYNVYMVEAGTKYIPSTSLGDNKELTVTVSNPSGCSNPTTNNTAYHNSSVETQVNTVRGKIVSHCALEVPAGGSKSANVTAVFKWYNLNINQDGHISKSYKYQLSTGTEVPDAYQQVEYISTTGGQYIDLGYYATEKTMSEAKLYTTDSSNKNWFGGSNDSGKSYVFNSYQTAKCEYKHGSSAWTSVTTPENIVNQVFTVQFGNGSLKINGSSIATLSTTAFTDSKTLNIFVRNGGTAYIPGRLYYFKLYENGTLVKDLVPVYRRLDNVIGLYDKITGDFFTNKGSGNFGKGNNI